MNLRQGILRALKRTHPYLMPEAAIRIDVSVLVENGTTLSEVRGELEKFESKGWAVSVRDEVTEEFKWKLTDEGRALKG